MCCHRWQLSWNKNKSKSIKRVELQYKYEIEVEIKSMSQSISKSLSRNIRLDKTKVRKGWRRRLSRRISNKINKSKRLLELREKKVLDGFNER